MKPSFLILIFVCMIAPAPAADQDLHADLDVLLSRYATENGVRYHAWARSEDDLSRLSGYVDRLETVDPETLEPAEALAYWINLYNAATLELVLSKYPLGSIKEAGSVFKSPWKKDLVTVSGEELSLDGIENEIIRKEFEDARIHFALNCASIGCPPLAEQAYRGKTLDAQLDAACRKALNDPRWVRVEEDRLVLTKIFDWYEEDFTGDAGSVTAFIARYRDDGEALLSSDRKIEFSDYDWRLNQAVE